MALVLLKKLLFVRVRVIKHVFPWHVYGYTLQTNVHTHTNTLHLETIELI